LGESPLALSIQMINWWMFSPSPQLALDTWIIFFNIRGSVRKM